MVEDNGYNQTLARIILQHAGFTVDIANDGEQAIAMMQEQDYQLILMDVHMPKLDGYAATKIIRQQAQWQQLPIIALTTHATADFHQECLASGMNDFITKPFDAKLLISKVFEWVWWDVQDLLLKHLAQLRCGDWPATQLFMPVLMPDDWIRLNGS